MHHETDTFTTTHTAIDPLRSADATVALDGFSGWTVAPPRAAHRGRQVIALSWTAGWQSCSVS